jgi:hypothetical protein
MCPPPRTQFLHRPHRHPVHALLIAWFSTPGRLFPKAGFPFFKAGFLILRTGFLFPEAG